MEPSKDLVTIKGTMDVKELTPYLRGKLNRAIEVVPPKKDDASKDKPSGDKKGKEPGAAEKKSGGDDKVKMEVSKMEHRGYSMPPAPAYWYNGNVYGEGYGHQVAVPYQYHGGQPSQVYYPPVSYAHGGYMADHRVNQAPQMFSDENPNACSVM